MIKSMIVQNKPMFSVVLCLVVFYSFAGIPGNTISAATINAASCEHVDVQAAIDSASAGDTIIVPAGSATWDSRLVIEKGINLIGAGIDNTTITHNTGYLWTIYYQNAPNDEYLRISGFTFDMNDAGAIYLKPSSEPTVATVRIDHNRFTNSSYSGSCVMNFGSFGVIDNNVIDDVKYPFRTHSEGQSTWYAYDDDFLGTSLNMYIEDNVIDFGNQPTDWPITDGDFGSRWAIRYNTIIAQGYHWSFTDLHGGRGPFEGGMGAEFYGNYIETNGYEIHMVKQGGGRVTAHHNDAVEDVNSVLIKLSENGNPGVEPIERQKMNNTYHFQNRKSTTGALIPDYIGRNDYNTIVENETYWMDNEGCVGGCSSISSGIGCGSILPTNCTPSSNVTKGSTAFWLTDQSCTSLSGLTGAYTEVSGGNRSPSSIIEGTLYVCTSTNTWTAWYTPYTYPHPLRTNDAAYEIIVNVFPNPCRVYQGENSITFFGDLSIGDNIRVFEISGRLVHNSGNLSEATYEWGVGDITSGIYLFVVKSADGNKKTSGKMAVIR